MAAGIDPAQIAENWAAVRRGGRRWAAGLCLGVAGFLGAVGCAWGALEGYAQGKAAACPQAAQARPSGPPRPG